MQTSNFLPLKCFLCAQKRKQLSSPWIFFMHIKMLPFRFLFACLLFVCSKSFCKKIKKPEITLIPSITYTTKLKVFFKPLWFKFKKSMYHSNHSVVQRILGFWFSGGWGGGGGGLKKFFYKTTSYITNQKLLSEKLYNLPDTMPLLWSLCFLLSPCYLQDAMPCQWSFSDLPPVLQIWDSVFNSQAFFTLHSFLLVLRLPWELVVQPQDQQGFMLILETQPRLDYLFESQQCTKEVQIVGLFMVYGWSAT